MAERSLFVRWTRAVIGIVVVIACLCALLAVGASVSSAPDEIDIAVGSRPTTVLNRTSLRYVPRVGEHELGPLVAFALEETLFRRICRAVGIAVGPTVVEYHLTGEAVRGDVPGVYVLRGVRVDLWHDCLRVESRLADRFERLADQPEITPGEVHHALRRVEFERFRRIHEAWRTLGSRTPSRRFPALVDAIVSAVTNGAPDPADRRDIEALTDEFPEFVGVRLWGDPGSRSAIIQSCLWSAHPLPTQVLDLVASTVVESEDVKQAVCLRLMTGPRADFVGLARVLSDDPQAIKSALDVRLHRARDDEERAWIAQVRSELEALLSMETR